MTLAECLEKWETGKHEYISYHDTKYYVNVYGFLFEYKTDLEFVVSNKVWLLSNEWRLVEKKVIPRGFNKNRDCSFYKPFQGKKHSHCQTYLLFELQQLEE